MRRGLSTNLRRALVLGGSVLLIAGLVAAIGGDASAAPTPSNGLPDWFPNGTALAFQSTRDGNYEIYRMNADGTKQVRLTKQAADDYGPTVSPDGKQIAFCSERGDSEGDIWVMNVDGSGARRLTDTGVNAWPAWSPDGQKIAYESERDGLLQVYVMNADGTGQAKLVGESEDDYGGQPSWSPDGRKLAFEGPAHDDDEDDSAIYVAAADGTNATYLAGGWGAEWSSDGRIFFASYRNGEDADIYVMNDDGTAQTRLTSGPTDDWGPAVSPGGQQVAFSSDRPGHIEVYLMKVDGSSLRQLTRLVIVRTSTGDVCTKVGTAGNDVLTGTTGNDVICGLGGADKVTGGGGFDVIDGGDAADTISGGEGSDRLLGGAGNDVLTGGPGSDLIYGSNGADRITPGTGDDTVLAGAGRDTIFANDGNRDSIDGGSDRDRARIDPGDWVRFVEVLF